MVKAPVGKRVIAYLIDCVIIFAVMFVLMIGMFILSFVAGMIDSTIAVLVSFLTIPVSLLAMLLSFLYWLLRDGLKGGRSLGKKFMKLRVVVNGSSPCGFKDSALRNITLVIPLLNLIDLIMPFIDAEGLRFGDKIAKTQVVAD